MTAVAMTLHEPELRDDAEFIAIDPGTTHSAYMIVGKHLKPLQFGKIPNPDLVILLDSLELDYVVIEMIGHYGTGMPAGQEVFDTCVWIGRFWQTSENTGALVTTVPRRNIKLHLCGTARAKDGNVSQALVDRFAPGQRNHGKGTKTRPGWFHGFSADVWQAYALAVYYRDTDTKNFAPGRNT